MIAATPATAAIALPGLNCGLCGMRTCDELAARASNEPQWLERCIHLSADRAAQHAVGAADGALSPGSTSGSSCGSCAAQVHPRPDVQGARPKVISLWPEMTRIIEFGGLRIPLLQAQKQVQTQVPHSSQAAR